MAIGYISENYISWYSFDKLFFKTVCKRIKHVAQQMLHLLALEQNLNKKTVSTENLSLYKQNPIELLRRIITKDGI